jgi:hypothetical protein
VFFGYNPKKPKDTKMKRLYFKIILNSVLFTILAFFILFVVFNYALTRELALGLSITFSLLVPLLVVKVSLIRQKKHDQTTSRKTQVEKLLNGLCFTAKAKQLSLFASAYEKLGKTASIVSGAIHIPENIAVFLRFSFDGLSKTEVVKIFNKLPNGYSAQIFAYSFDKDIKSFCERFNGRIKLLDGKDAITLLEKAQIPLSNQSPLSEKKPSKVGIKDFLDRKKAKSFLRFGLFFMVFSFFVPYKLYYIIFGTVLSLFAVGLMVFLPKPQPD